jgi:hypothetical protein
MPYNRCIIVCLFCVGQSIAHLTCVIVFCTAVPPVCIYAGVVEMKKSRYVLHPHKSSITSIITSGSRSSNSSGSSSGPTKNPTPTPTATTLVVAFPAMRLPTVIISHILSFVALPLFENKDISKSSNSGSSRAHMNTNNNNPTPRPKRRLPHGYPFMFVSHQWRTAVRQVPHPCIQWYPHNNFISRHNNNDNITAGFQSRYAFDIALSCYPSAARTPSMSSSSSSSFPYSSQQQQQFGGQYGASFINFPYASLERLITKHSSIIPSLRHLSIYIDSDSGERDLALKHVIYNATTDVYSPRNTGTPHNYMIDLCDTLARVNAHGIFRSFGFVASFNSLNLNHQRYRTCEWYHGAIMAQQLLQPYNTQYISLGKLAMIQGDDHPHRRHYRRHDYFSDHHKVYTCASKADEHKYREVMIADIIGTRCYGQQPVITFNGQSPIKCNDCQQWTYTIGCDWCHNTSYRLCCQCQDIRNKLSFCSGGTIARSLARSLTR